MLKFVPCLVVHSCVSVFFFLPFRGPREKGLRGRLIRRAGIPIGAVDGDPIWTLIDLTLGFVRTVHERAPKPGPIMYHHQWFFGDLAVFPSERLSNIDSTRWNFVEEFVGLSARPP